MNLSISVVVLTYNEEKNIEGCLDSIQNLVADIFIVDSYSSDNTLEIVRRYTNKIYQHPFEQKKSLLHGQMDKARRLLSHMAFAGVEKRESIL